MGSKYQIIYSVPCYNLSEVPMVFSVFTTEFLTLPTLPYSGWLNDGPSVRLNVSMSPFWMLIVGNVNVCKIEDALPKVE